MSAEENSKERKAVECSTEYLSDLQSVYIAALAAARADGVVDSDEETMLFQVSQFFGHEQVLNNAFAYFEAFQDNGAAMEGVMKCLEESSDTGKLAAFLFMQAVAGLDGVNEKEADFLSQVKSRIGVQSRDN